jgi:hypothetical protein
MFIQFQVLRFQCVSNQSQRDRVDNPSALFTDYWLLITILKPCDKTRGSTRPNASGSWLLLVAPQLPPCAQRIPGVNLCFAGEPLAEIRGSAVKPFEPDAGNAAEGSGRRSVLRC